MTFSREIERVWKVQPQVISPIHTAGTVLEPGHWQSFDPFLLMMEDSFEQGAFDWHPHRGQETVTYVIDGSLEHYDNKGNTGILGPGDVQWMTAGRGIIHLETPPKGVRVHLLQLWINLPREKKMVEVRHQILRGTDMPIRKEDGAVIRVYSGSSGGVVAYTKNYVPVTMVELSLDPGAMVSQDLPGKYNGFIYVLDGEGKFGSNEIEARKREVLWLGDAKDAHETEVVIRATSGLRALLIAGQPLNEPVVAHGPFVMNTKEEIFQAYKDFHNGKFDE